MNGRTRKKKQHERVVRINITLAPRIYDALENLIQTRGYGGPSEYLASRVRTESGMESENQLALFGK